MSCYWATQGKIQWSLGYEASNSLIEDDIHGKERPRFQCFKQFLMWKTIFNQMQASVLYSLLFYKNSIRHHILNVLLFLCPVLQYI